MRILIPIQKVQWYKFSVGLLGLLVVDVVALCLLKLFIVKIDYPESRTACGLKNVVFINNSAHCGIVKLPPLVFLMVLDKVKEVSAICIA